MRDGTIDCIATDHAPHAPEEKEVPFEAAPFGVIGLETAFPALYTGLVEPGVLALETVVERMTAGPARAFGLAGRGIAVGRARRPRALGPRRALGGRARPTFRSRSRNCAFLGRALQGRCLLTAGRRRRSRIRAAAWGAARERRSTLLLEDGTVWPRR